MREECFKYVSFGALNTCLLVLCVFWLVGRDDMREERGLASARGGLGRHAPAPPKDSGAGAWGDTL